MDCVAVRIDLEDEESGEKKEVRERSKTPPKLRSSMIFPRVVKSLLTKILDCPLLRKSAQRDIMRTGSIEDEYRFGQLLSYKREQKVRICYSKETGTAFCCKSIRKLNSQNEASGIYNEVEIMRRLTDYHGIVKLLTVYDSPRDEFLHLVMELCSGGDLFDALQNKGGTFTESQAASIFKQVIQSIRYCHDKGVIHCDIKLENVFLADNNVVKLGDFDLAIFFKKGKLFYNIVGSKSYMAPEMVENRGYWEAVDIWSAGVMLYAMLAGHYPFDSSNEIATGHLDLQTHVWSKISDSAKNLITGLLCKNPVHRPTISEILDHPWFQEAQAVNNKDSYVVIQIEPNCNNRR